MTFRKNLKDTILPKTTRCIQIAAGVLCIVLMYGTVFSDQPIQPYPKVTTSSWGDHYFIMIPARYDDAGNKMAPPFGRAFELLKDGSAVPIWEVRGWYAPRVFLSDSGKYLVRLGNWALGSEPSAYNLAVAFYANGKELAKYSTMDLIENKKSVIKTASHYFWRNSDKEYPKFEVVNQNLFLIKTIENKIFAFDVTTGALIEIRQEERQTRKVNKMKKPAP